MGWQYFDFISFAQYLTISKEIPAAAMVFTESQGVDSEPQVVRRDPRLMDNEKLPAELYRLVGDAIYTALAYGFEVCALRDLKMSPQVSLEAARGRARPSCSHFKIQSCF